LETEIVSLEHQASLAGQSNTQKAAAAKLLANKKGEFAPLSKLSTRRRVFDDVMVGLVVASKPHEPPSYLFAVSGHTLTFTGMLRLPTPFAYVENGRKCAGAKILSHGAEDGQLKPRAMCEISCLKSPVTVDDFKNVYRSYSFGSITPSCGDCQLKIPLDLEKWLKANQMVCAHSLPIFCVANPAYCLFIERCKSNFSCPKTSRCHCRIYAFCIFELSCCCCYSFKTG
jgi:hypothetical protein